MTLLATDPRVVNFYESMLDKPKNSKGYYTGSKQNEAGLLYVIRGETTNFIQVWLPMDLIEYSNAAAGSAGARPVGIRVGGFDSVESAAEEILNIFDSPANLARFINSSAADYHGMPRNRRALRNWSAKTDDRMADDTFAELHQKYNIRELAERFGKENVIDARKFLTVNEFELRFGLAA